MPDGEGKMKNVWSAIAVAFIGLVLCSGCDLLEDAVSDINDWDVSACVDGFGTCWELFWDNSDKFEDGFVDAMEGI